MELKLWKDSDKGTSLHIAADKGFLEIVRYLSDHSINIDARDFDEVTPLQYAVLGGHLEIVKLLCESKTQIDTSDKDGSSPLHYASMHGYLEIVKFLVEKGAQIDLSNNNNETLFHIANQKSHKEKSKYLLDKKREAENPNPKKIFSNKDPCIICLEPRNSLFVLIPCGHMSLCEACSYNLIQHDHPKCPTCRKQVRDYTKVFYQAP